MIEKRFLQGHEEKFSSLDGNDQLFSHEHTDKHTSICLFSLLELN